MNALNLVYANMVKEAQTELNKFWIPNVGDLAINEIGMLGVITNNYKQDVMGKYTTDKSYIGVSLVHNGRLWSSLGPIWMPRLDQIISFTSGINSPQEYISRLNRWIFKAPMRPFTDAEELAFSYYMFIKHNKEWNFEKKVWEL